MMSPAHTDVAVSQVESGFCRSTVMIKAVCTIRFVIWTGPRMLGIFESHSRRPPGGIASTPEGNVKPLGMWSRRTIRKGGEAYAFAAVVFEIRFLSVSVVVAGPVVDGKHSSVDTVAEIVG